MIKFYGGVRGGKWKNWLNCGYDLGLVRWAKDTIIDVTCPEQVAGNDPERLELAF